MESGGEGGSRIGETERGRLCDWKQKRRERREEEETAKRGGREKRRRRGKLETRVDNVK